MVVHNTNRSKTFVSNFCSDQANIDSNINGLRNELKDKMAELRKLEGKPELKGYNLTALDRNELRALNEIIPEVVNF